MQSSFQKKHHDDDDDDDDDDDMMVNFHFGLSSLSRSIFIINNHIYCGWWFH